MPDTNNKIVLRRGSDVRSVYESQAAPFYAKGFVQETTNPFTGETAPTDIVKITQEDYAGSRNPISTSQAAEAEINSGSEMINQYDKNKQNANVQKQINSLSEAEKLKNKATDTIDQYTDYLDSAYKTTEDKLNSMIADYDSGTADLIDSIKENYRARTEEMKTLNKSSLGAVTKGGIRSGRQRYASEINQGILTAEESAGINRIKALANEEAQLIAKAKLAKTEQDWKMFSEAQSQLQDLQTKKVTALKDQLDIIDKVETMAQTKSTNALAQLKTIASVNGDIPADLLSEINAQYGEGFAEKYVDVQATAAAAETEKNQVEFATKVIGLLNDIPEGEEITIGDTTYTGLKVKDPNTKEWLEKDASGQYKVISYDINTKEITVKGTGVRGTVGDGSGSNKSIGGIKTTVVNGITIPEAFVGRIGSDNKVDTDVYKQVRNTLDSAADRNLFDENYRWMLNTADPTAVDLALPKTFNDEQQTALEAALGTDWYNKPASVKLEALTEYEKNKRKELGIGTGNQNYFGDISFGSTTSTTK